MSGKVGTIAQPTQKTVVRLQGRSTVQTLP